jgi:5,10-methylenetetrahydrofolate reductase
VNEFLFVYGDKPTSGGRTSELTVRSMIEEVRGLSGDAAFAGHDGFRVGVAAGLGRRLPEWKREADFVFAQVCFSVEALLRWRDENPVEVPVFAGVMVVASEAMAARLAATVPDIEIPTSLVEAVRGDRDAGVSSACEQVVALRDSGAFDGVHLVPVGRYRQVAARLEAVL